MKTLFTSLLLIFGSLSVLAQVTGTIKATTGETLAGVNIRIEGTYLGTATNTQGQFKITPDFSKGTQTLIFSFVGFETTKIKVEKNQTLDVTLLPSNIQFNDVIVSASRIEEKVMEAPVTVEQVTARQMAIQPGIDLFPSLARYKGIDVNQTSLFLNSLSTRGFNQSKSERIIQLVDFVDVMYPSLSLYTGNFSGAPDLDIESVDIIHGANSALYGANAFNGVLMTNTKDPFQYEGLSVSLRGGNRDFMDGSWRFAQKLTNKLAIKFTGSYTSALEFVGNNMAARNLSIVANNNSTNDARGWDAQHRYGDASFATGATLTPSGTKLSDLGFQGAAFLPGYTEIDLTGGNLHSKLLRLNPAIHYLITDKIKANYEYRYGSGGGIYQSSGRFQWNYITFGTHKFEVKSDKWFVRAYRMNDTPGLTYDLGALGNAINAQPYKAGANPTDIEKTTQSNLPATATYSSVYSQTYIRAFEAARKSGQSVQDAYAFARQQAANVLPNGLNDSRFTPLLETARNIRGGTLDPTKQNRSSFWDFSSQYQLPVSFANAIVGGSYRKFHLTSKGTLYSDGPNIPRNGIARDFIDNYEFGVYGQIQKSLVKDALKLSASGRLDNFKNFGTRFSPRLSAVYTLGDKRQHNFRANYAQAYRSPTQLDQNILLDFGTLLLVGNINGGFDALPTNATTSTPTFRINTLAPEQMNSWEIGYKGMITKGLYIDINYYRSHYTNFIGTKRFYGREDGTTPAYQELLTPPAATSSTYRNRTRLMQVWLNSDIPVNSQGIQASLDYYVSKPINLLFNYTYASISDAPGLILGFNTPQNKFNIGVHGEPVKHLNYAINLKKIDTYNYFMPFDEGIIQGFTTLDAQVSLKIPNLYTTFKLGGTNLTNANAIQAYGSAPISRIIYAGLVFECDVFQNK